MGASREENDDILEARGGVCGCEETCDARWTAPLRTDDGITRDSKRNGNGRSAQLRAISLTEKTDLQRSQ
jgi:hypothetical protein